MFSLRQDWYRSLKIWLLFTRGMEKNLNLKMLVFWLEILLLLTGFVIRMILVVLTCNFNYLYHILLESWRKGALNIYGFVCSVRWGEESLSFLFLRLSKKAHRDSGFSCDGWTGTTSVVCCKMLIVHNKQLLSGNIVDHKKVVILGIFFTENFILS